MKEKKLIPDRVMYRITTMDNHLVERNYYVMASDVDQANYFFDRDIETEDPTEAIVEFFRFDSTYPPHNPVEHPENLKLWKVMLGREFTEAYEVYQNEWLVVAYTKDHAKEVFHSMVENELPLNDFDMYEVKIPGASFTCATVVSIDDEYFD